MGRVFPMERTRLLGWLIVVTFALAVLVGPVLGVSEVTGAVFSAGFFLVLLVAVLGDSLPVVRDRDGASIWRRTGREFSKGRNLADDEQVDAEPTDPVEELRAAYVAGELDEGEFERRLERLLETDAAGRESDQRDRSLELE